MPPPRKRTPPIPPLRRRKPRQPRLWRGRKLTSYGRDAVSLLLLVGTLFLRDKPALPVAKREEERPPDIWAVDMRGPEEWWGISAPGRKVPSKPFPEQKTPPCAPPDEETIAGGCWLALRSVAPCASTAFEHAGRCYHPIRRIERLPTSLGE